MNAQPTPLAEAIGGVRGMIETSAPALAFVVAYVASGSDTETAALVALGLAVLLAVGRLARRESPQYALSGLVGVGIAALLATKTGKAENFYLPGLLLNLAYASAFFVSILVRWPLVGVLAAQLLGEHRWRDDPHLLGVYTRASWLWVGLFSFRLLVQLPMYLAEEAVALGIARTVMGVPLFLLGIWWTYRVVTLAHREHPSGVSPVSR